MGDDFDDGQNKIVRRPDFGTVALGARVTYVLEKVVDQMPLPSERLPRGFVCWEPGSADGWFQSLRDDLKNGQQEILEGVDKLACSITWSRTGTHMVACRLGGKTYYTTNQSVQPLDKSVRDAFGAQQPNGEDPEHCVEAARGRADLLRKIIEKRKKLTGSQKDATERRIEQLERWAKNVSALLQDSKGALRIRVKALLFVTEQNLSVNLHMFVASLEGGSRWVLVDYTNPNLNNRSATVYEIGGRGGPTLDGATAAKSLISKWESDNQYSAGVVQYQFPPELGAAANSFRTTGRSVLGTVADYIEYGGLAVAIGTMAGVALFVVPGGQLAAGLIWASVFAGVAATGINAYERVEQGQQTTRDTVFDVVQVAAMLIPAGRAWGKGATLLSKAPKLERAVLYGQVGVDLIQGALVADNMVSQLDDILDDESSPPEVQAERLERFLHSLAVQGIVQVVTLRATAKDLSQASTKRGAAKSATQIVDDLKVVGKEVKILDEVPHPPKEGQTSEGRSASKVQTTPGREPTQTAPPPPPMAVLPDGTKIPPHSYSGGYHGCTDIPPEVAMVEGLPARGTDWSLQNHAEGGPNTAYRGTTALASDPINEGGAAYWAGEGGYVYQITGVPTWDVNKALEGRVKRADGTFRGNLMHGENEFAIEARVPPDKIVRWGIVKETNRGLSVDWQPMASVK